MRNLSSNFWCKLARKTSFLPTKFGFTSKLLWSTSKKKLWGLSVLTSIGYKTRICLSMTGVFLHAVFAIARSNLEICSNSVRTAMRITVKTVNITGKCSKYSHLRMKSRKRWKKMLRYFTSLTHRLYWKSFRNLSFMIYYLTTKKCVLEKMMISKSYLGPPPQKLWTNRARRTCSIKSIGSIYLPNKTSRKSKERCRSMMSKNPKKARIK